MASTATLERQLRIGGELQTLVTTMKGLAAIVIHEFEESVAALDRYQQTIELGLQAVFIANPELRPPLDVDPGGRVVAIVVGTDQGLCGPINREIAQEAAIWLNAQQVTPAQSRIIALGHRIVGELAAVGIDVDQQLPLVNSVGALGSFTQELIVEIDGHQRGEAARVMAFHQQPLQRAQRTTRVRQLLPVDGRRFETIAARPWPTRVLPDTPHDRDVALAHLLRQDLFIALYTAIAAAKAAEHGARLAAMHAAEQNIEERLDRFRSRYHQLRQAQITSELLDVVSGFELLRDGKDGV